MMVSKRNLLFQGLIFRFHVKLPGCKVFGDGHLEVVFSADRSHSQAAIRKVVPTNRGRLRRVDPKNGKEHIPFFIHFFKVFFLAVKTFGGGVTSGKLA